MKRFTFLNIYKSLIVHWALSLCHECLEDIEKTLNLKDLEPRPWKCFQTPLFAIEDCPEKVYNVGLYVDEEYIFHDKCYCNACGENMRASADSVFWARSAIRSKLEKQLVAYTLYRKLLDTRGKKETDMLIYLLYK